MGKLLEAYTTEQEVVFKKVKGTDGNTYHFKDGTPVTENSFNGGLSQKDQEGQPAKVAIPSDKGPGFEREKVDPGTASGIGVAMRKTRDDVNKVPPDQIEINGTWYNTYELAELNQDIIDKYENEDIMFKY